MPLREILLVLAFVALGCGSSTTETTVHESAAASSGTTSGSGGAGGSTGSPYGLITAEAYSAMEMTPPVPVASTLIDAVFRSAGRPQATSSACRILDSTLGEPQTAGDVSLSGGPGALSLSYGGSGYTFSDGANQLWQPGQELTLHATGGEVPAFSASASAPSAPVATSPAPQSMQMLGPNGMLQLTWQNAPTEMAFLASSGGATTLVCIYPGQSGTATLARTDFGPLAKQTYAVNAFAINRTTTTSGTFAIELWALAPALAPDMRIWQSTIQLE